MQNITSYLGEPHVTSDQFRSIIESIAGAGNYIADLDEQLEPELSTNNTLKIRSGVLIHHGHVMRVPPGTYDTVTYINGSQGMKRIDLVVARYEKNSETKKEPTRWVVIQGTPDASSPVAPDYNEGNIQDGDLIDDCPVFEMHFDGINVTEVKKLVEVTKNIDDLRKGYDELYSALVRPTLLYTSTIKATGTYQLIENILNYKTIEIIYTSNKYGHYKQSVRMIIYGTPDYTGWNTGDLNNILHTYDGKDIIFQFTNFQSINVVAIPTDCSILSIYGWKY